MVKVMRSYVRGPLAPFAAGLAGDLLERGYTRESAAQHMCFVAHLDRWLTAEGLKVEDLDAETVDRYLGERRATGYVEYLSRKAMAPLLSFVEPLGALPPKPPPVLDAVEELVGRYREYLLTNDHLLPTLRGLFEKFAEAGGNPEVLRPLLGVDARYLDQSFAEADRVWGGMDEYLAGCLGLDDRARGTLRDRFLQ